jgi:hypothetical protein
MTTRLRKSRALVLYRPRVLSGICAVCMSSSPGPTYYVVGARAAYSYDGGAKWSAIKTGKDFGVQDSILRDNIACASVTLCTVASGGALFSTAPLLTVERPEM